MRIQTVLPGLLAAIFLGILTDGAKAACPGSNQMELGECASIEAKKADAALNAVYRKLEKTPELVAAQRSWIAYRDAECKYQYSRYEGGTIAPMIYSNCVTQLTTQRTELLESSLGN